MTRRQRTRLANSLPWLGLLVLVGALVGALRTFQGPYLDLSFMRQIDPDYAPPLRAPGLEPGAVVGLALGALTLLARIGRRTALRLLRPGRHDVAWALAAGFAVSSLIFLHPEVDEDLLFHPALQVPRWFLVHSRGSLLLCIALCVGAATWGSRVALRARPRHARRIARLGGASLAVAALVMLAAA